MKNAYLFAIEMDQWGKKLSDEINHLVQNNASPQLIDKLESIKKNLGLLAIYITGSLDDDEENKLINQLVIDCEALETLHLSSSPGSSFDYHEIRQLIDNYQLEKQKSIDEVQEVDDIVNNFNKLTNIVRLQSPQKKLSPTLFKKANETIVRFV